MLSQLPIEECNGGKWVAVLFFYPIIPFNRYNNMESNLILSKESSESEIKAYFNAVLKLAQSASEFPINLDEVWMLVYSRRQEAVRALTTNEQFIEDIDYQTVRKDAQQNSLQGSGGANKVEYYLTVSCMEYFIARKVRSVFEVYRQVFHKTAEFARIGQAKPKREPSLTTKVRVGLEWVKGVSDMLKLNDASKLLLLGKVAEPLELPLPDYVPSKGVVKSASELLKERGLNVSAREFNIRAMENGYLCEMVRNGKGHNVKYKSITEKGLAYGENQVNPNNPKSTQPLWYADKFGELLTFVGL